MPGEVRHVVVGQGADYVAGQQSADAVQVGVSAGAPLGVGGHVGQCGVVDYALGYAAVERGGHDGQRAALASALHDDVAPVPLGQRRQQVDAAHEREVDAPHVVAVGRVEAV